MLCVKCGSKNTLVQQICCKLLKCMCLDCNFSETINVYEYFLREDRVSRKQNNLHS